MRIILLIAGIICLGLGLVSMVTPIPGGTILLAIGAALVICTSPHARAWVRKQRSRYPRFHSIMEWLEKKSPTKIEDALHRTRPDYDPNSVK